MIDSLYTFPPEYTVYYTLNPETEMYYVLSMEELVEAKLTRLGYLKVLSTA